MNRLISPKYAESIMKVVFWGSGILTILLLLLIIGYILVNGLPVVNLNFLLSDPIDAGRSGGIYPMIISTFYVTFVALVAATH